MARYWVSPNGKKIKCESHIKGASEIVTKKFFKEYIETHKKEEQLPLAEQKASTQEDFLFYYKNYIKVDEDVRDYLLSDKITKSQRETIFELIGKWVN